MNFVFTSPQFPQTYWNFCDRLRKAGVNVLGIGDADYGSLDGRLKSALSEYYKVGSMEDYDQMFKAVAYLSFKWGKIDWLESNNEYWLRQDAHLRSDFAIRTGVGSDGISAFTSKAEMKKYYALGGVPTARQSKVDTIEKARTFIRKVGYPVVVKPEVGVGATATYKLSGEEDLEKFFSQKPSVPYVMEEFITGDICSYDAIIDSKGEPLFESSCVFPPSVMDIVNMNLDCEYHVLKKVPPQLRKRGRATVKAFGVRSRFVHMEFFRLTVPKKGLGEVGDFIGLEVNMRPAGGFTPDMMNFAHHTDVYQIWADMVVHDRRVLPQSEQDDICVHYGRRDGREYVHSREEVVDRYRDSLMMEGRMPDVLAADMGNQFFVVNVPDEKRMKEFISFVSETR